MKTLGGEYGVEFVQVEKFEIAATDATTQAAKLKAVNPDAVLVIGASPTPFRNVRQLKMSLPIVAAHPSANYETIKAMGDAADNIVHAEYLVGEDPLPHQREFVEAYQKEYGKLPKHFAAAGWDAVMVLAATLKDAGANASGDKLCATLRRQHEGAMTRYDFAAPDMGGLTLGGYTYSKLVGGRFTRIAYKAAK
jgi:branched-chain amino acid transport system substrate-binding protein